MAPNPRREDLLRPRAITVHLMQPRSRPRVQQRRATPADQPMPQQPGYHPADPVDPGYGIPEGPPAGVGAGGAPSGAPLIDPLALYTPPDLSGYGNLLAGIHAPAPHIAVPLHHPVAASLLHTAQPAGQGRSATPAGAQARPQTPAPNPLLARLLQMLEQRHSSGRRATPAPY